ncbi:MAG: hypothetical protein KF902_07735 [Phycisphaeraceae bacterium]|nr:hypothetical protein [Phycisphaeraceae bacterium]MBX3361025.1 hypothetical protein [Phycisphaeraceae bacterium]MCW5767125.1 hypothetical protein [Phycisphaeraceae bacterium]
MRWMWIDRVVELQPRQRLVSIKHISLAEEHMHEHFAATEARSSLPVMPGSLIVEGVAQSGGILIGHALAFEQKIVLAKVTRVDLDHDATAGDTLRYTITIDQFGPQGASTKGVVDLLEVWSGKSRTIGHIDLMFSVLENNMAGIEFPEGNFVFGEAFKTLMRNSGVLIPGE